MKCDAKKKKTNVIFGKQFPNPSILTFYTFSFSGVAVTKKLTKCKLKMFLLFIKSTLTLITECFQGLSSSELEKLWLGQTPQHF